MARQRACAPRPVHFGVAAFGSKPPSEFRHGLRRSAESPLRPPGLGLRWQSLPRRILGVHCTGEKCPIIPRGERDTAFARAPIFRLRSASHPPESAVAAPALPAQSKIARLKPPPGRNNEPIGIPCYQANWPISPNSACFQPKPLVLSVFR